MYGGFSGSQGVLLYNTKKESQNGVYGYYEMNRIVLLEGEYLELREVQKEQEASYKHEKDGLAKWLVILFFFDLAAVGMVFSFGGFLLGLSSLIMAAGSYFPILIIYAAQRCGYKTKELHEQFRRFHGCEHQAISWMTNAEKSEEVTREKLESMSIYDGECGTAYAGSFLALSIVVSLTVANILTLGLWKTLLILLATVVILLLNVFNPYNPFFLIQRRVVAEPGDREYALVQAVMHKLRG